MIGDRAHFAQLDNAVLMSIRVTNAGPQAELLHVLPTMWFRNTWSWDSRDAAPTLAATVGGSVAVDHPFLGKLELLAGTAPDGTEPQLLFCDNETNRSRLYASGPRPAGPKTASTTMSSPAPTP